MTAPEPAPFLTITEAANEIRLCRVTVAKYIALGQMPGYRFGKTYRIPREQWDDFKAGRWVPRPTAKPIALVKSKHVSNIA